MKQKQDPVMDAIQTGDYETLEDLRKLLKEEYSRIQRERERMKIETTFFDKKMEILQNGFADLEADRKRLEREKIAWEAEKKVSREYAEDLVYENLTGSFFAGVNNTLALKKRYRDLLKIFHPDNLCGDTEMVTRITLEYERLRDEMDFSFKNVN